MCPRTENHPGTQVHLLALFVKSNLLLTHQPQLEGQVWCLLRQQRGEIGQETDDKSSEDQKEWPSQRATSCPILAPRPEGENVADKSICKTARKCTKYFITDQSYMLLGKQKLSIYKYKHYCSYVHLLLEFFLQEFYLCQVSNQAWNDFKE